MAWRSTSSEKGGHGSRPHTTIDPVMMVAHFIVDVQSVISREKDASKFGVITIGSVDAGNAGNVIPDTATVRGTVRSCDNETRVKMLAGIERTAKALPMMANAPEPEIRLSEGATAVVNDDPLSARRGAEGGVRRQGTADVRAGLGQRGLFGVHHRRRAVVLLQHRRPRSLATIRRSSRRYPSPASAPAEEVAG